MPLQMPEVDNDLDLSILEEYEFTGGTMCDVTDCDADAAAMLKCGECEDGVENVCTDHGVQFAFVIVNAPEERITFDQTCGHSPKLGTCKLLPLA